MKIDATSFIVGAVGGLALAYLFSSDIAHQAGAAAPGSVINSSPTAKTSTGDARKTYAPIDTVPPNLAAQFIGGNTAVSGQIGQTGLTHGPAQNVPYPCTVGTAVDGKKVQNGYCIASLTWSKDLFCGATSITDAKNRIGLALARYIAGKLKHPTNYYETPQFIAAVQQAYPTYVSNIAAHMYPTCNFKPWAQGQVPSDHTQNDGIFDPTKQIGDDMLHFGCMGQPGIAEYGNEAIPGDPRDCLGESAVPPTSPYHTS